MSLNVHSVTLNIFVQYLNGLIVAAKPIIGGFLAEHAWALSAEVLEEAVSL